MIVVTSHIRVVGGDADGLAEQYARRMGLAEQAPGCVGVEVLRHSARPDEFVVYTRWHSREDYDRYRAGDAFREAHRRIRDIPGGIKVERVGEGVDVFDVLS